VDLADPTGATPLFPWVTGSTSSFQGTAFSVLGGVFAGLAISFALDVHDNSYAEVGPPDAPTPQQLMAAVHGAFCAFPCLSGDPSEFVPGVVHGAIDPIVGIAKVGIAADSDLLHGNFGAAIAKFNDVFNAPARDLIGKISNVISDPEDVLNHALHPSYGEFGRGLGGLAPAAAIGVLSGAGFSPVDELVDGVASGSGRNLLQDLFSITRQKGLGDIASGTRAEAEALGEAWVNGKDVSRFNLNGGGYGLTDGARTFRLQFKPADGVWKANFQENTFILGRLKGIEVKNIHMTITDMVPNE
jgi:hypothetical protein